MWICNCFEIQGIVPWWEEEEEEEEGELGGGGTKTGDPSERPLAARLRTTVHLSHYRRTGGCDIETNREKRRKSVDPGFFLSS